MSFGVRRFRRLLFVSCASLVETNLLDCTDTMIVGHLLGDSALGAIGLFWPCMEFLCFFTMVIAGGTAIAFSESVGIFESREASRSFSTGFFAILGVGVMAAAGMYFGREACFSFLGVGEETLKYFRPYWTVFSVNALLLPMSIYLATMVCADGDGLICTIAFVAEFFANAVFSYWFCLKWGAAGCALGTIAGTLASLLILPMHFFTKGNTLRLRPMFSWRKLFDAMYTDFPESSDLLFTGLLYMAMNRVLVTCFGDGALTVMDVVVMANAFTYFLYGVAKAAQPIVGVYFSEGDFPAVRTVMSDALVWSVLLGGMVSGVLVIWPEFAVELAGVSDPELYRRSCLAVRIVACGYAAIGVSALFVSYFLFIGRIRISFVLAMLQGVVCPTIGCLFGVAYGGEQEFWLGYMLATPVALVMVFVWLAIRRQGCDFPFMLSRANDNLVFAWNIRRLDAQEACRVAQDVLKKLRTMAVASHYVTKAVTLVKDVLMEMVMRNRDRRVDAEVVLNFVDGVRITFRDGGRPFSEESESHPSVYIQPRSDSNSRMAGGGFDTALLDAVNKDVADSKELITTGFNRKTVKL